MNTSNTTTTAADAPEAQLPTHADLLEAYQDKRASLSVNQINHREFVMNGKRYFCGYSSKSDGKGGVSGWKTYKSKPDEMAAAQPETQDEIYKAVLAGRITPEIRGVSSVSLSLDTLSSLCDNLTQGHRSEARYVHPLHVRFPLAEFPQISTQSGRCTARCAVAASHVEMRLSFLSLQNSFCFRRNGKSLATVIAKVEACQ